MIIIGFTRCGSLCWLYVHRWNLLLDDFWQKKYVPSAIRTTWSGPLVRSSVATAVWCWARMVSLDTCWKPTWLGTKSCMRATRTWWQLWETLLLDASRNRQARTRLPSPRRSFARNIANAIRIERRRALRIAVNFSNKSLKWSEVQNR